VTWSPGWNERWTEGFLGYVLQQALLNHLRRREIKRYVVTMITHVLVEADDPVFQQPSKPIGPFLTRELAEERRDRLGWKILDDAGRGWRRLVASPRPVRIVQRLMIRDSARAGHIVIACEGSMGPKVEAIVGFLKAGGKRGLITSPARLAEALDGRAGTHFVGKI